MNENNVKSLAESILGGEKMESDLLSNEEIAQLIPVAEFLKKWASSFLENVNSRALKGESFPGYKLVEGKSTRTWINQDNALNTLVKAGYEKSILMTSPTLNSVAEIEKLIGKTKFKEEFSDLVSRSAGKPTLVVESDKRPALNVASATDDFKDSIITKEEK